MTSEGVETTVLILENGGHLPKQIPFFLGFRE
jgi:hypothetical protein